MSLIIALDSGAADYDTLWVTTSLRGGVNANLRVDVLDRGMHSGLVSGAVPSSMRIIRQLLNRIEDPVTGEILMDAFHCDIPEERVAQARAAAAAGLDIREDIPYAGGTQPPV